MKKLLSLSLLLFLFSTCKKDAVTEVAEEKVPVADFSSNKPDYNLGETIELTNASVDAETIRWTLPDGTTSKANTVSYPTSESNVVKSLDFKLEATSKSGIKTDYIVKKIYVKPPIGKLLISQTNWPNGIAGELTIGSEFKGEVNLKSAIGSDVLNCENQNYLIFDVPIGITTVIFTDKINGFPHTRTIYISKVNCNKLLF